MSVLKGRVIRTAKSNLFRQLVIFALIAVSFLFLFQAFQARQSHYLNRFNQQSRELELSGQWLITTSQDWNLRQSVNNCGVYSTTFLLKVAYQKYGLGQPSDLNPEILNQKITWKVPGYFTTTNGLEELIAKQGLQPVYNDLGNFSKTQRLDYLKFNLSQGRAMVVRVKQPGSDWYYRHFITIVGFDNETDSFMVYDSLAQHSRNGLTRDENGPELPGNRTYDQELFYQIWSQSDLFGTQPFYNLIALPD